MILRIKNEQIKREITVAKIGTSKRAGRLKATEPTVRRSTEDVADAAQVCNHSVGQPGWVQLPVYRKGSNPRFVPVVGADGLPLMPCRPSRAKELINKGSIRKDYGSTYSLGIKRGSLVQHKKYGLSYVGGNSNNRISLHSIETGERLAQNCKLTDTKVYTYNKYRT